MTFLGFASFFLTLASLPTWAVQGGSPQATAGLVTTVMLAVTVAVQGLVPWAVRRLGIGTALVVGLTLLGAPAPLYGLSSQLPLLLAVSAVRGAGFALLTVISATLSSQVVPPERRGESIGLFGLAIALPNLVCVPAGVALTAAGHFTLTAVLAACPVLAIPLAVRAAPGVRPAEPHAPRRSSRSVVLVTLAPSAVLVLVTAAGGGLVTFLPIERPDGRLATAALLVFGTASALARWRSGLLADRVGTRVLLPVAVTLAALGMGGVALCLVGGRSYDAVLVVAAAAFGVGYGGVQNLTLVVAFRRAGAAGAPVASALWNAAFDSGTAMGAFAVGAVAATGLGLPWTMALSAVLVLAVLPVALALSRTPLPLRRNGSAPA